MTDQPRIRVAVNGYGVIGKRVADAVIRQPDMRLVGVGEVAADWRTRSLVAKDIALYAADDHAWTAMRKADIEVAGPLEELIYAAEIVVDCTPKGIGAKNADLYRSKQKKFILQGGEAHEATRHSFVAEANYESAIDRECTRVVSCNTTAIVRALTALKRAGLLRRAKATILRRATDPWEAHLGGIMNTLVPERTIPSHQSADAKTVDPDLDLLTVAVKVPQTLAHLLCLTIEMSQAAMREEVLLALDDASRILLIRGADGLTALNAVKELTNDLGRPRADLYEVAVWGDMLYTADHDAVFTYMVDNQSIVVPETIDAIRALMGWEKDAAASMARTNEALGVGRLSPALTSPEECCCQDEQDETS